MPEYLAPAVYVEEVDTGSKPIEGVSTSTSGMIGVTERGPVGVPMLVTSYGEYQRLYGQMLRADSYDGHRFLPHAVEGFFLNGGKRVYVVRVLEQLNGAPRAAERALVAPDVAPALEARLLRPAMPGTATVTIDADPGYANGDMMQIGEGLAAEFVPLNANPAAANLVVVRRPLAFAHAAGDNVTVIDGTDNVTAGEVHADTLNGAVPAGANALVLANPVATFNPALAVGDVFRVDVNESEELVRVAAGSAASTLQLDAPLLLDHANGAQVHRIVNGAVAGPSPIPPGESSAAGETFVPVVANAGMTTDGDTVEVASGVAGQTEYRRIGAFRRVTVDQGAYVAYPAGSVVEQVVAGPAIGGARDLVGGRDAAPGDIVITVSDRTGIGPGDVIRIGLALPQQETIEIAALVGPTMPGANPGAVALRAPLRFPHLRAALGAVQAFAAPINPTSAARTVLEAPAGTAALAVNRSGLVAGLIRVTTPAGATFYHTVNAAPAAFVPQTLSLATPLTIGHPAHTVVARRVAFMTVRALDQGIWGNRLRVAMEEQTDRRLLTTTIRQILPGGDILLTSNASVEVGTELVVTDALNNVTTFRVDVLDRQNNFRITPAPVLPATVAPGDPVVSREYRFVLELLRQPDPVNPSRNTMAIDREVFSNLSLDNRHSQYFESVIGCTFNLNPGTQFDDRGNAVRRDDRRSEGASAYVRVFDAGFAASASVRPGPIAAYQQVPGAPPRLILLPLGGGFDDIPSINADIARAYMGIEDLNPEGRTGLAALRNIEEVSIVAAPGQTDLGVQMALVNHCELMRYRFAVLDGVPPPGDSIPAVQQQRQQFDTKYAALYHPWLLIQDPFPDGAGVRQDYPIAPSGHMVGIYARTDIERGVHKAPANEVVRGVLGLQRVLNKEQHDILNPYPVNINVIRDFRLNNRGIRVYGGRVITSDSDWKYVNVRRLLIFIEASVDRGLQWVVFEPNAEPLWARVRRSISNFLTLVWRNGALEGTRVEEAYFVKCDRTTMTQTDIDQGRLIVLVGVAPVKPAEFVIVRIGLWTAHAEE